MLACASLLAVGACRSEERSAQRESRALAARVAAEAAAAAPATAPSTAPADDAGYVLHLDGSQSMAGFVGCRSEPTTFDQTIDRLVVDLGVSTVSRFGAARGAAAAFEPMPVEPSIHCAPFYDRAQNPDGELYARILADTTGRVHVYLTDGVQSDLTTTQSPSVSRLREWLAGGRPLAILALRSRYDGRGWSEAQKQWTGRWRTDARPFYAFVFAPTDAALDRTLGRLSASVRDGAQLLRFGDGMVGCRTERGPLPRTSESATPAWAMFSAPTSARLVRDGGAVARLVCDVSDESPLGAARLRADRVEYGRWTGSAFTFPAEPPPGVRLAGDSVAAVSGGFETFLRARLANDPATRFGFFAVHLLPDRLTARPAVDSLSTETDATEASADRTYRFAWVVEQLLRTQVERAIPRSTFAFTVIYR